MKYVAYVRLLVCDVYRVEIFDHKVEKPGRVKRPPEKRLDWFEDTDTPKRSHANPSTALSSITSSSKHARFSL